MFFIVSNKRRILAIAIAQRPTPYPFFGSILANSVSRQKIAAIIFFHKKILQSYATEKSCRHLDTRQHG